MTSQPESMLMPAAFLGHGSPMNALEQNRFSDAWHAYGTSMPAPRAILAISAHWYINATAVTAMEHPKTIHDFFGFPPELFAMDYPAPGDPELAAEIADLVSPTWVGQDIDSWGLDHGTWSVLVQAFPEASTPVVQLSINAAQPYEYHIELGAKLAPLRERGVAIVCSGNVVHNLGRIDWSLPDAGYDWAASFDAAAQQIMKTNPASIEDLRDHEAFALAVPTPDHFIPLLYLAGLAVAAEKPAELLIDGLAMGSLSMTSFTVN